MTTIDCPKCEYEHEPTGSHEADSGEHTCDGCGCKFTCEIEYDPDYITSCVEHVWEDRSTLSGDFKACKYCQSVKAES